MKVFIEVLEAEQKRVNAQQKESRFQPVAVFISGQRFPKERKYYLGTRPSLKVGRYSLDLSDKISLQQGSENAPPIFDIRFNDADLKWVGELKA